MPMATWTSDELARIEGADELRIASLRRGGALGSPRTIWVVRIDDDLYVRSVNGRTSDWFGGTQVRHEGRHPAGGGGGEADLRVAGPGPARQRHAAVRANDHP